ncbi:MAG: hypothetical protein J6C23_06575 [Clostridia bacterium]|nr:hypothetical protein [Clostridia bacterium]
MRSCEIIEKFELLSEIRKREILESKDNLHIIGNTYYVSCDGNDNNDGLTPHTAWATLDKVSSIKLNKGDGVLFRRGDVFRGCIRTQSSVTYGAYGEGEKPKLYGWDKNLANPAMWEAVDEDKHVYKLTEKILDVGTLVFNDGEKHSIKLIPSYKNGKFVCRENESKPFVFANEAKRNLDFYWHFDEVMTVEPSRGENFPIPSVTDNSLGDLYLRCDEGNPGKIFTSIEALTHRPMFAVGANNDVRIDNLCIKYVGTHAISAGGECVKGLRVTNCEIGWVGGCIQHYFGTDPNYPQGGRGTVTRFGNGVEIYGGCENYAVGSCYIHDVYDAGVTHQITTNGKQYKLSDISYVNNLIERCVYSIEYFLDMTEGDVKSVMQNVKICGNILKLCGYGWGQQRHNVDTPAHIKGWEYVNRTKGFSICDNILDRSAYRMIHIVADEENSLPKMCSNTYIQHKGKMFGTYGATTNCSKNTIMYDENVSNYLKNTLKSENDTVYIV